MNEFKISDVEKDSVEGYDCVKFTLITDKGCDDFIEWITDDDECQKVETVDSHIMTNQSEEIVSLFDMKDKPSLMPDLDYIPLQDIFEELQEALDSINNF
jgi:hypothetical protein